MADIPVQEEAAVVSVEDIAGETEDEEITITASATKAYAKTSKVVTLTVKKAAKNGKVTIRKRTPKGKYKITVTAAGKGIYGNHAERRHTVYQDIIVILPDYLYVRP